MSYKKQVKEEGKVVMISSTQSSKTHNTKEHNCLGMQIL